MKKFFFIFIFGFIFMSAVQAAPIAGDADIQMNDTLKELERQRIQRQIEEDMKRREENITDERDKDTTPTKPEEQIKFELKDITVDESAVLKTETIDEIKSPYLNREVTLDDIFDIVQKINDAYEQGGFMTCRAYLQPQTIKEGIVHISLSEGTAGEINISGNNSTREYYVRDRISLDEGNIPNIKKIDKDITRFNATNDAQLRLVMKAGKDFGTTDFEIVLDEPQRSTVSVIVDNTGQESTGEWREGIFYNFRSLAGVRDLFSIGYTHTIGSNALNVSYEFPITTLGTKFRLDYSTNGTEVKKGDYKDLIRSHATYYGATITHPLSVSLTNRSEWSLSLSNQKSTSTFENVGNFSDNKTFGAELAFSQLNYGVGTIFYQRHAYRIGNYKNLIDDTKDNFGLYKFSGFVRKVQPHGQSFYGRIDAQLSSKKDLPSSEQYYLGGFYSVRGYKEKIVEGNDGFSFSLEYSVPLDTKKTLSAFTFLDGGKIINSPEYAENPFLLSTGLGLKYSPLKNISANVTLGFPLKRNISGQSVSKSRINFAFSGAF